MMMSSFAPKHLPSPAAVLTSLTADEFGEARVNAPRRGQTAYFFFFFFLLPGVGPCAAALRALASSASSCAGRHHSITCQPAEAQVQATELSRNHASRTAQARALSAYHDKEIKACQALTVDRSAERV